MVEEWRPVIGYENLYEVSNLGNVRSLFCNSQGILRFRFKPKTLKQSIRDKKRMGYLSVNLGIHYKIKTFLVHTLVLTAFISPKPEGMEASHKDDNVTNNKLENLFWETHADNMKHARYINKHA